MSETNIFVVDKSRWGSGPWKNEPDKLNWIHADMDCMIARHPSGGHLCGYVAVSDGHPVFEKGYDDVNVTVHGGLTYANKCNGHLCHVPEPGRPNNVWWLGFDCAHPGDLSPGYESHLAHFRKTYALWKGDVYRDIEYLKAETNSLAEQLSAMLKAKDKGSV